MNEKRKQLYEYLSNNGMTDLTYDDFSIKYGTDSNRFSSLYSYLRDNNMTDLDSDSFMSEYFGDVKKNGNQPALGGGVLASAPPFISQPTEPQGTPQQVAPQQVEPPSPLARNQDISQYLQAPPVEEAPPMVQDVIGGMQEEPQQLPELIYDEAPDARREAFRAIAEPEDAKYQRRGQKLQPYIEKKVSEKRAELQDELFNLNTIIRNYGDPATLRPIDRENLRGLLSRQKTLQLTLGEVQPQGSMMYDTKTGEMMDVSITPEGLGDDFINYLKEDIGIAHKAKEDLTEEDAAALLKRGLEFVPSDVMRNVNPMAAMELGLNVDPKALAIQEERDNLRFQQNNMMSYISDYLRSVGSVVAGTISGTERMAEQTVGRGLRAVGVPEWIAGSPGAINGYGESVQNLVSDIFPTDPDKQDRFRNELVKSLGSLTGFMLVNSISPQKSLPVTQRASVSARVMNDFRNITPALYAAGVGQGGEMYKRALEATGDPDIAAASFWRGMASGGVQVIPMIGIYNRMNSATGGRMSKYIFSRALNNSLKSGADIAAQDFFGTLLTNMSDNELYDFSRQLMTEEEIGQSLIAGLGAMFTGLRVPPAFMTADYQSLQQDRAKNTQLLYEALIDAKQKYKDKPVGERLEPVEGEGEMQIAPPGLQTAGEDIAAEEAAQTQQTRTDETQEQQEQAVLEGVRDGRDETQAGAEGAQLRAEAEEEVAPSEGTQEQKLDYQQTDSKGRAYTYYSNTSESGGVTTTTYTFNRSDKDSSSRNKTGVPVNQALGDKYEIPSEEIPEGAEVVNVLEIREGADRSAATVTFESNGRRYQGEVLLSPTTPSEGTQAEAPLQQPTPRVVPEAEAQPGDYFTREIDGETLVYQKQDGAPHRMLSVDEANAFLEEQRAMQEQQVAPPTPAPPTPAPPTPAPPTQESLDRGYQEVTAVKEGRATTTAPVKIFKGKFGKRNPDGTIRSAHTGVNGAFGSSDIETAKRYEEKGVEPVEFILPAGTTMEVVEVEKAQGMSTARRAETDAINASDAQVVKLITLDGTSARPVEQYIIKDPNILNQQYAIQEREAAEVPMGEQAEGGQEVQPTQQEAEAEVEAVAEKTGVKAKNLRDLYNVNRDVFGLNRLESLTNAIVMDRMVGAMAKRAGISKESMYGRLEFVKGGIAPKGALLQQADFWKSTAKEGIGKIQQKAATPEQWVKMIADKGGKGTIQELEWIGLQDFLTDYAKENNLKSVPKEVVEQYIADNQIEIVDVAKLDVNDFNYSNWNDSELESDFEIQKTGRRVLISNDGYKIIQDKEGGYDLFSPDGKKIVEDERSLNQIKERYNDVVKKAPTKYSQYTLEGGENYREILLTLPQEKPASEYKSSHWDETNVLAHLRLNERTLPNGERVLFIEEVQSDWAQEGKKKGFKESYTPETLPEKFTTRYRELDGRIVLYENDIMVGSFDSIDNAVKYVNNYVVPQMPYKKTDQWVGMAMRRAMQMAAQEGFDRVAWVTGEQSAERYDLSKQVDRIDYSKNSDGSFAVIVYKDGNAIDRKSNASPQDIEDYIGKELAERVINDEGKVLYGNNEIKSLEGQGLVVGGEGMKTFYNSILPKVAKKEAQRFDKKANVEVVDFSDIEIIELEVQEGVKNSGQKFWYASGRVDGNLKTGTSTKSREDAISKLKENSTGVSKQLSIAITPEMRMNLNSAVPLFQGEQGAMLAADGKAIIYALSNPNVSTPLHEMAHVFEHYLTDAEKRSVLRWAGKKEWDTGVSEKFARGAEKYLAEGKAPTFSLQKIFDKFKQWLTDIYNGIKGSEIDLQLNDGMRDIYSKMLGVEVEQAAEQEAVGDADQTARNYGFTNKHHAKNAIQKYLGEDVDADAITEDQVRRASEARAAGTVEQQMEAEQVGTRNVKNTGIAVNVDLKGIWDWTAKKWRKHTKSRGLLPKNVFDKYIRMVGSESAALKQVDRLRTRLDRAVKNDFGTTYNKMSAQQKTQLDLALRGDVNAMNNLPIATREVIADMRRQVDALSQMVIDLGLVEGELEIVLQENMGTYLTRSYRKFEDPDWISNVPEQIVNRAKNFIRQENPELTQDEVDGLLTYLLQKDAGTDLNIFQKAPIGSKGKVINLLKGRKEIPFELRQLYGEYSDPFINYSKSITKIASLLARDQFLKGVREDGLNVYLFERPTGEYNVPIAGAKSKALEPLNGLFTTKDISDAFRSLDPADPVFDGGLDHGLRMYLRLNGLVKTGKTIASPQTHFRNFYGNILIMVNNGYLFDSQTYREISPTFNKVYKDLLNKGDKDFENYLLKLTRLRVTDESVNANDLKGIIKDIDIKEGGILDWIQSSQAGKIIKATQKGATKLYQAEDDFYKIIAFEVESRRLKDAYGDTKTQEWIDERAAQKVRMILPTYSLVPKFIKQLRRFPFVGTFVSFPFEIIRTYGNTINLAYQELNSPQERAIGQKRAAGIMLNTLLVPTISALSAALIGVDDEERQAARRMMAPWTENSDILWLERGDDGLPRFIDMGYSDPYNYLRKPINTIVLGIKNGEQPIPLVVEAGSEMLKPFAGEEILARHVREVLSNKKTQTGSAVYNPQDEWDNITIDILEHLSKALEPGGVSSARRIYKGFNKEAQSTGRVYDPTEEILAIPTGQRWQRIDPLYAVQFKFGDAMDAMQDAKRIYNSAKYRGDDINAAYEQSTNRQEQIYNDLKADYDAAMKLMSKTKGVDQTKNELDKILKDAGFNSTLRNQLRSGGGYLPFDIESGRQTKPEGSSRTRQTRTRELRTRSATTRDLR